MSRQTLEQISKTFAHTASRHLAFLLSKTARRGHTVKQTALAFGLLVTLFGCSGNPEQTVGQPAADPVTSSTEVVSVTEFEKVETPEVEASSDAAPIPDFKPLSLSGASPLGNAVANSAVAVDADQAVASVIDQLKPLQVMPGQWRGTTRRDYEGFKAVDSHEWIWDLQSDADRPALVMSSDKSPYLQKARITWDSEDAKFLLTATDGDGTTREYSGDYTEPVREIVGEDDKLHRVFRLEFTQNSSSSDNEAWQIAFAQQENNRYLLEVAKRRGKAAFQRYDTVSTQREGTSFAISDDDYGDKECIISQGLGTIAVSYQGKTYWVCCSGCKAAFEEDPATWIARAVARKKDGA